jgi:dihydrolipoamide dehydrogenase
MSEKELVIIGGGPAGYVGAIRATQLGLKVTVVEKEELGGTCLNIGCIPTKCLLSYADDIYGLKDPKQGITVKDFSFDKRAIYSFKDVVVGKLTSGVGMLFKSYGIELIKGNASFESNNTLKVGSETITFKKALIATGSKPMIPSALFVEGFTVDSTYALSHPEMGKKIVVIGGGVIGCELSFILNAMGMEVTIVEKMKGILITEDRDTVRYVEASLKAKGIRLYTDVEVTKIEKGKLMLGNGETLEADTCVVAIGRVANTQGLEPQKAGVTLGNRKEIIVDKDFKTSNPNIFAVGDVTGSIQLAHYASACACKVAADMAGSHHYQKLDVVPRVTYSLPELASVGHTEMSAKEQGLSFKVGRFAYAALGKALAMNETEGFVKVLADENDKIIGAAAVGADAENLIAPFTIAIALGLKVSDLTSVIYAHPTLSEIILEACEDVSGSAIHKGRKRN